MVSEATEPLCEFCGKVLARLGAFKGQQVFGHQTFGECEGSPAGDTVRQNDAAVTPEQAEQYENIAFYGVG